MAKFAIYRWDDLGFAAASFAKMRTLAEMWGISGSRVMTRAELRKAIVSHPNNESPVPHPLIEVPLDLHPDSR